MPNKFFSPRIEKMDTDLRFMSKNLRVLSRFMFYIALGNFIVINTLLLMFSKTYSRNFTSLLYIIEFWFKNVPQPWYASQVLNYFKKVCGFSFGGGFVFAIAMLLFLVKKTKGVTTAEGYNRGARKAQKADLKDFTKGRLPLGKKSEGRAEKLFLPYEYENRGVIILGSAGTGKSVLIRDVVSSLENQKCIIYDRKGEFIEKFYSEGDVILNFLDARNVDWNIYNEIKIEEDVDSIATSIAPNTEDPKERFWRNIERTLIKAVIEVVRRREVNPDFAKLSNFIFQMNTKEKMSESLQEYPDISSLVEGYIAGRGETAASAFASYNEASNFFKHKALLSKEGGGFSIRDYVHDEGDKRKIFLVNQANVETFRGLITLFLDLAFKEILSLRDDINRRIFLIIDEFPSLFQLDSLERLLAEGRSKGSCPVIAAQDFTQIERIYERGAPSIFNNSNTKIIFRISEAKSTRYISDWLGEQERTEIEESITQGTADMRDSYYYKENEKIRKLYLPSEIANMQDLRMIVKVGAYPAYESSVEYREYETREIDGIRVESFVPQKTKQEKGGSQIVTSLS